jgi:hypothetical protein
MPSVSYTTYSRRTCLFSRSFQSRTVKTGDSEAISVFLRRSTVVLTSGALVGVGGGGGLAGSVAD